MNPTMISTIITSLVGAAAMWLASKIPFIDQATWSGWINSILTIGTTAIIGWLNRSTALLTTVANSNNVKAVTLSASAPAELVANTPANVTK